MKFWKNNRLDVEFDMPVPGVARLFTESTWADHPWPLDRRLRVFLTAPAGPISAGMTGRLPRDPPSRSAAQRQPASPAAENW